MATTNEKERSWQDRDRPEPVYRPPTSFKPTPSDWSKFWNVRDGRIHRSKCPVRMRTLVDAPMGAVAQFALYSEGHRPDRYDEDINVRMFLVSGGNAVAAFQNRIGTCVLSGFFEIADSLDGIAALNEVVNFMSSPIISPLQLSTLAPLPRGATAKAGSTNALDFGETQVVRYARALIIDEQDLVNMQPGFLDKSLALFGRGARQVWCDLAWFEILSNPTLAQDGIALFHTDHGNLASGPSSALGVPSVAAGLAAIHSQVLLDPDAQGGIRYEHLNLSPAFLIVPPAIEGTARATLRLLKMDDPRIDLALRVESRLSAVPTRNPLTGATVSGSDKNWLLSCDKSTAPWILKTTLTGQTAPNVRSGMIDEANGQYGLGIDCTWSIAAKAIDFRGVYWSEGA